MVPSILADPICLDINLPTCGLAMALLVFTLHLNPTKKLTFAQLRATFDFLGLYVPYSIQLSSHQFITAPQRLSAYALAVAVVKIDSQLTRIAVSSSWLVERSSSLDSPKLLITDLTRPARMASLSLVWLLWALRSSISYSRSGMRLSRRWV